MIRSRANRLSWGNRCRVVQMSAPPYQYYNSVYMPFELPRDEYLSRLLANIRRECFPCEHVVPEQKQKFNMASKEKAKAKKWKWS